METERLHLIPLQESHTAFIFELVNTPGWIANIGDRKVHSELQALGYIKKILEGNNIRYWVVTIKESGLPAGLVTLIQRDYLPHPDIGFAFLPAFMKKGYAFEAASALLQQVLKHTHHRTLCATTIPENSSSIRLLHKLGFRFKQAITVNRERLFVYQFTV